MKIKDINPEILPVRVKLTNDFPLEDSFDAGMIIQIDSFYATREYVEDVEVYRLNVRVLAKDVAYNKKVAQHNWFDSNGNPTLDYFEANPTKNESGDYEDFIYVMGNDDFFEMVSDEKPIILTNKELYALLDKTYRWGRDNGTNRSDKNFNDMLEVEWVKKYMG